MCGVCVYMGERDKLTSIYNNVTKNVAMFVCVGAGLCKGEENHSKFLKTY
jgi:hypothetical protein